MVALSYSPPNPPIPLNAPAPKNTVAIPYSQENEESVLGSILLNPSAYYEAAQFLTADDFYILRTQYIWQAMEAIAARNESVDSLTVANELRTQKHYEEVGGAAYLNKIVNATPTSAHIRTYAQIVQRKSTRRRLMKFSGEVYRLAADEEIELSDAVSRIEAAQVEIVNDYTGTATKSMHEASNAYYAHIETLMNNPTGFKGLCTGLKVLDHMLSGIDPDTLSLFAGRPGMGKSSLLTTIALNIAKQGKRVAYFSLEMSVERLMRRIMSQEACINSEILKTGKLNQPEWARFVKASGAINALPLFIDDTAAWTPLQLRAKFTSMKQRQGIDVFVIDHAQLLSGGGRYANNKTAEAAYISRALKEIVQDLKTPMLVAAQLNRNIEQRQDKRPLMSDIRESGTWEQDADNIIGVYRDEVYNEASEFPNQADLIVLKQRDGKTGTVSCYFEKTFTKFMNAAERSVDLSHI